MEHVVKTKQCLLCFEVKPVYEFNQLRTSNDGINSRCRLCVYQNKKPTEIEKLRKKVPKLHSHWKI